MTALAPPQAPVPPAPRARPAGGPRARSTIGSRRRLLVGVVIVIGALGFLLYQGLGSATLYFRTADEAVADRGALANRRFRIEGTVMAGTIRPVGQSVAFDIGQNGALVHVVHTGDQPQLFKDSTPVVLEGRWDGEHFASDRIMIKHSEDYKTSHPDRVQGATQ